MWCHKCQADVAAMASSDNERLYCTTCNSELPRPVALSAATTPLRASVAESAPRGTEQAARKPLHDPHELLARWAREDALGALDAGSAPLPREKSAESRAQLRFDVPHAVVAPQVPFVERLAHGEATPARSAPPAAPEMPRQDIVIHPPHLVGPPHFYVAPVAIPDDKSSRWVQLVGQIFAYLGVGGLTVGTVLVLMGYFGGPASYATTGWLITTAGQMLLFLGVVTLVSGGMEQTTQEVARRIDTIGERLVRIEQATVTPRSAEQPSREEFPSL